MKLFHDAELIHQHMRGSTGVIIVGARSASAEELSSLGEQFVATYGDRNWPVYFSGNGGWQIVPRGGEQPAQPAVKPTKPAKREQPAQPAESA